MKAERLPSGKYRIRVYDSKLKKQVSFIHESKKEAERQASLYRCQMDMPKSHKNFETVANAYIENRSAVLSPGTIREYKRLLKYDCEPLYKVSLDAITGEMLQQTINKKAVSHSPKTVKCLYCFICAVIRSELPLKRFIVDLPKKTKVKFEMASEDEIKALLKEVENTQMEVPILLALFGPMRRAEICALDRSEIHGNIVHVKYAVAQDEFGEWVRKAPKTYSGDRYIEYPEWVIKKLPESGPVTELTPNSITARFPHIMKRLGMKYTFHQMRHWSVSYLHKAGLSDQEILDRAGWQSTGIFKEVYRHGIKGEDRAAEVFKKFKTDLTNP